MSDVYIPTTRQEAIDYAMAAARLAFVEADQAPRGCAAILQTLGNSALNIRAYLVAEQEKEDRDG